MKKTGTAKKSVQKKPAQKNSAQKQPVSSPLTNTAARPAQPAAKKPAAKKPKISAAKKPAQKKDAKPQQSAPKPVQQNAPKSVQQSKPKSTVSKKQKKEFDRAVRSRTTIGKKRGSRGGNYSLYYLFAAFILVIVLVILANTVLFDCSAIEVEGSVTYAAENVSTASGIKLGDNLLRADLDEAEQKIVAAFPYIDMAEISRISPTKIKIVVTEAEKWYCVRYGSNVYTISRRGKILEQENYPALPVIIGFDANSPEVGTTLASKIEAKTDMPAQVLLAAETAGLTGITSLNMNDRFELELLVDGRITLKLGDSTQLENKMHVAAELVNNVIGSTESVTVDLTNPEKVPVRDNNIIDNQDVIPVAPVRPTEEATAESTAEA